MFARKRQLHDASSKVVEVGNELGSEVLGFLASHGLPPTPRNYYFAYLATTEPNGLIALAVDAVLMNASQITHLDVDRILSPHNPRQISEPEGPNATQDELRRQTLRLADIAAAATASSGEFEMSLQAGLSELATGSPPIRTVVEIMLERTRAVEKELEAATNEIEVLRQEVEAARGDALRDALTGLLNRRGISEELRARARGRHGTIAICDIDHFKSVNDRFGHAVGDRVLRSVATSLSSSCGLHQVARWGGEEFLIVVDDLASDQAVEMLERARRDLAKRAFKERETRKPIGTITISIGAASFDGEEDPSAAIERADRLLYRAKREGRNRVLLAGLSSC